MAERDVDGGDTPSPATVLRRGVNALKITSDAAAYLNSVGADAA